MKDIHFSLETDDFQHSIRLTPITRFNGVVSTYFNTGWNPSQLPYIYRKQHVLEGIDKAANDIVNEINY